VVDKQGNIWIALTDYCEVVKYNPATGTFSMPVSVDSGGTAGRPSSNSLAVDGANNLWVVGRRNADAWEISAAGQIQGPWAIAGIGSALTSAVDQQGNIWASTEGTYTVTKIQGIGAGVLTPMVGTITPPPLGSINGGAPTASAGSVAPYSTNAGGEIAGLSGATSVTITFANHGWANAAFCTASPSVALTTQPYNVSQGSTGVTFMFPSLTGSLFYTCTGN
jgi:hypothetical protein